MTPLYQNILITFLSFIYVFGVVGILDYFVRKGLPQDLSRKLVHMAAGSWLIFWPLFSTEHWTKYLNIAPALLWTVLLFVKGFTAKPDDQAVKTMTRNNDRRELLRGPLYFTVVMDILGTLFFYNPGAIISMGFLGWGDGLAPVIGKKFGKHKYKFLAEKTVEGSIAFFLFGCIGAAIFSVLLTNNVNFGLILLTGVVTTIVEGLRPKDLDNIFIPISAMLVYYLYL